MKSLTQQIKVQAEKLEKEREEMNKRFESVETDTQKQIDESLKALAEASEEHTYDYTPYASSYEGVDRTLNAASSNISENRVESESVNKKAKPSEQTFFEEVISYIKDLFK